MIHIVGSKDVPWEAQMTGRDLLLDMDDPLSFSGMVMNRRYYPRSLFEKVAIHDRSVIQMIPSQGPMTITDLIRQVKNLQYCSDVIIGERLYPEVQFHEILVPEDAEVMLLPPMQGG